MLASVEGVSIAELDVLPQAARVRARTAKGTEAYNNMKDAAAERIAELKNRGEEVVDDIAVDIEMAAGDLEGKLEEFLEKAEAALDAAEDTMEEKTEE